MMHLAVNTIGTALQWDQ